MDIPFTLGHRQRANLDTLLLALKDGELGITETGLAVIKNYGGAGYINLATSLETSAVAVLTSPTTSGRNLITPIADIIPLRVGSHASQTFDLQTWETSAGAVRAWVDVHGRFQVLDNYSANGMFIGAKNSNNSNGASHAYLYATSGGASGGDAFVYLNNSVTDWVIGLDNSDSDAFKISKSGALGTNDYLVITTAGRTIINSASDHGETFQVSGTAYISGTLAVAGLHTASGGILIQTGGNGMGRLGYEATSGVQLRAGSGSTYDLSLLSAGGGYLFGNPTGTNNVIFPSATVAVGAGSGNAILRLNGAAGSSKYVEIQSAGLARWLVIGNNDAESGADAGTNFEIRAYSDSEIALDAPLSIVRAAGGPMTLSRPVAMAYTLGIAGVTTLNSASVNQLIATGGTTVNTRVRLNRGSDDITQYAQFGWDRIETVRSATPLASGMNGFSFNQVGSDGTRTPLAINGDGTISISALSSGRVPVVSTSGLLTQDDIYWATGGFLGIGAGASSPTSALQISKSSVSPLNILVNNTDNSNGNAHARLYLLAGGASGGDACTLYDISGGQAWTVGVDNVHGDGRNDAFRISAASSLGTNDAFVISTAGVVTIPGTLGVTGLITATSGIDWASDLVFSASSGIIRANTSDGSDNKTLYLAGGGAFSAGGGTRGSGISLSGNDVASVGGSLQLSVGEGATAQMSAVITRNKSAAFIMFDRDSETYMQVDTLTSNKFVGFPQEFGLGGTLVSASALPSTSGQDCPDTVATPLYIKIKTWNGTTWDKTWVNAIPNKVIP